MNQYPRILLSGGAGYIGNILTQHLLKYGYQVTVFDNLIHRQGGILENCGDQNFNFIYGDVRDKETYGKLISEYDIIVNLAAYVGAPLCDRFPCETVQVNQESAEFLASKVSKDQLVIFTTTNSGYGLGEHKDGQAIHCTEETPLKPISLYGNTKALAERAIMESGTNIAFRLATVFGVSRKMRMDLLVNDFVYRAWNDRFIVLFESHFLRNFVHVRDVARTVKFAIDNQKIMRGQVYNVGNTEININKKDLCLAIKKHVPDFYITESEYNKDPDKRNYICSNAKLEGLLWKCDYSLDMGIQEVLKACPIIKNSNIPFSDI